MNDIENFIRNVSLAVALGKALVVKGRYIQYCTSRIDPGRPIYINEFYMENTYEKNHSES